ncbi:hypothetical protein MNV49_001778 [Pseudohyphozyma bogoriensis]|nr:hypothetical protein MNV49_001778 [Pseudohyphozyma bogoriensis]
MADSAEEEQGTEILKGDVLLKNGLIAQVGPSLKLTELPASTVVVDAHGAFLTPGIFDMHSHIGVYPSPGLDGASDGNSVQNPILPYLRSLDSGGQAFAIKLRETAEKTPDSKVLEMPYHIPSPHQVKRRPGDPPRWRHMKAACGENIRRVYGQVRMDLAWNFRKSFEEARKIKVKQDEYCEKALAAHAKGKVLEEKFPEGDLQWEALVDLLRGKVKLNTHCYESTDFAAFIRHSQEFQFPIAAFHHAHEAWLVPDLLKQAYGTTPAVAIFATNARYKREAWRGTEYAAKILSENNITVIMKSDHPVLDSRYLAFEAQQAHHFGLAENLALASITTLSAATAGFGHRLGLIRANYDADVVLWDSHPLSLGATPLQVFIDGIPQLDNPYPAKPPATDLNAPPVASVPKDPVTLRSDEEDEERSWSFPAKSEEEELAEVVFTNVSEVLLRRGGAGIANVGDDLVKPFEVHFARGALVCVGECVEQAGEGVRKVDLKGGSLLPPLVAFGPALGLTEMISEESTTDAEVYDPLLSGELSRTQQLWGPKVAVRAIDGLELRGKHLQVAKEAGVGKAVTAPLGEGFFRGVSVAFRVDANHVLEEGAVLKDVVALHVTLGHYKLTQRASVSTQIAELRRLLLGAGSSDTDLKAPGATPDYFAAAGRGEIPLVVNVWKADTIASLILLKREVEAATGGHLKWAIHGGQESHLLASELASSDIAVILSPPRAFPESWDERRVSPGPPTTKRSVVNILHNAGVKIGLGVPEEWQARTLLWEAAWAQRDSNDEISRPDAIAWLSSNLEDILDVPAPHEFDEFVAHEVPLLGFFALPSFFSISIFLLFGLPGYLYLNFSQTDPPHNRPLPSLLPFIRLSPRRMISIWSYTFQLCYEVYKSRIIPLFFDYCARRVLVLGGRGAARLVREGVKYGSEDGGRRLDVYSAMRSEEEEEGYLAPVVVFVTGMGHRGLLMRAVGSMVALRLRRLGFVVVVPEIIGWPEGRASDMVADMRKVLVWTNETIAMYGGDPNKIHVFGWGTGAHISLVCPHSLESAQENAPKQLTIPCLALARQLTIIQDAVVTSRDAYLAKPPPNQQVQIAAGIRRVRIPHASPPQPIPRISGLIFVSGVFDVIKQLRHEVKWGIDELSSLRRVCGPSTGASLLNCPSHLLYGSAQFLPPHALPSKILIIAGGKDVAVPFSQAVLMKNLLTGIGVEVALKLYKEETHLGSLASLMQTTRYSALMVREIEALVLDMDGEELPFGAPFSSPIFKEC